MECGVVGVDIHPDQMENMPTAFVCNSDLTASMVINQLEEQGYRVPEDFSVVGFDNYLFPGLCDVEITTYEVDIREMANKAIHVLLKKSAGNVINRELPLLREGWWKKPACSRL